jgi:hypothetical protein
MADKVKDDAEDPDVEGTGSSYYDLVEETDVPRIGDEGVEGVDVAAQQVSGEKEEKAKASAAKSEK